MLNLSPVQQKTVAAGLTVLSTLVILSFVAGIILILAKFVYFFSNVFLPLAVAGALALLLKPYSDWLRFKLKFPAPLAVTTVYITCLIPFILFLFFFGFMAFNQISELAGKIPQWYQQLLDEGSKQLPEVQAFWEKHGLNEKLQLFLENNSSLLIQHLQNLMQHMLEAGVGISHFVAGFLGWLILPVYLAFFLLSPQMTSKEMEGWLPFLKQETRNDVIYLCCEFIDILIAFFRGQFLIALAQGILFAIGFSLVGLQFGFVIGFCLGLLNLIPYLGNIVGLAIALPTALFQTEGGWVLLLLVCLVFVFVQVADGLFITPKIMGDRTGLHPLAIIVAIFFWGTALNGIAGMLLAIPLTAFFVVFWRLIKQKYIRELV